MICDRAVLVEAWRALVVVVDQNDQNQSCYLVLHCSQRSHHSKNLHLQARNRRNLYKCLQNPMVVVVGVGLDETAVEQSDQTQKTTF